MLQKKEKKKKRKQIQGFKSLKKKNVFSWPNCIFVNYID